MQALFWSAFLLSALVNSRNLCVHSEFANLRKGPGTDFEKTLVVNKYTPLEALGKQGAWYEVKDFRGNRHWIRNDNVKTGMSCVVVKEEFAYLRQGPGRNWTKREVQAPQYVGFLVLDRRPGWLRVKDIQGDIAWIAEHLVWGPKTTRKR